MNKLGIIVSIYNGKIDYLDDLFISLEKVREIDDLLEVIIVDNGSLDMSYWNKIQEFAEGKHYVKIKRFEANEGKQQATWYGLNNLESKYVQVLDYDDFLIHENVKRVIDIIYKEQPDISFLTYPYYSDKNKKVKGYRRAFRGSAEYKVVNTVPINQWHFDTNTIINRELMLEKGFKFPDNVRRYEDVYINMFNLQYVNKTLLIDLPIYMYRVGVGGQLSSTTAMMNNFEYYKETVFELAKLDYSNIRTNDNQNYIFNLNYLSFSYFNSISNKEGYEIKEDFKKLNELIDRNTYLKKSFWSKCVDVVTLKRKNYLLTGINKIVLILRR